MESELRQFERRIDIVQRYVENLVTGAFLRVKNDVDLSQTREVMDKQVRNSMVQIEQELLQSQQQWINRINALFVGSLGILAGMSVMHIIILAL